MHNPTIWIRSSGYFPKKIVNKKNGSCMVTPNTLNPKLSEYKIIKANCYKQANEYIEGSSEIVLDVHFAILESFFFCWKFWNIIETTCLNLCNWLIHCHWQNDQIKQKCTQDRFLFTDRFINRFLLHTLHNLIFFYINTKYELWYIIQYNHTKTTTHWNEMNAENIR